MKCLTPASKGSEDFEGGVSGNDPRFTSEFIDKLKEINYPEELLKLVESQYIRFGDKIKLQTKSHYVDVRDLPKSAVSVNEMGGYIGVYQKPAGIKRLAVPPIGENSPGKFTETIFTIVDPTDDEKQDFVLYGDLIALIDQDGLALNCKNNNGSLDGYLTPHKRGQPGEVFVSFTKTGKKGEPIVYGEPGVRIKVEESNRFRNSFAGNIFTNFKYSKSKVKGGYICCHGGGHGLNFFIHPESGTPDGCYVAGTTMLNLRSKSKTTQLLNFLNNTGDYDSKEHSFNEGARSGSTSENSHDAPPIAEVDHFDARENTITKWEILFSKESAMLFSSFAFFLIAHIQLSGQCDETPLSLNCLNVKSVFIALFCLYAFGFITPRSLLEEIPQDDKMGDVAPDPHNDFPEHVQTEQPAVKKDLIAMESDEIEIEGKGSEVYNTECGSWRSAGVDEKGVPKHPAFKRFLDGEFGNMKVAIKRWNVTCKWRETNQIDNILSRPHPMFEIIKKNYPHFLLGRSKKGHPVYFERPGETKIKQLFQANVSVEDLLYHYVYISEFLWNVIEPEGSQTGQLISVIDLTGIKFKDFFGDAMAFLKNAVNISQAHYPERSHKIYILNIPRWFNVGYKIIKPFVAESTLEKVRIFRKGYEKELADEIGEDLLQQCYGGNNTKSDYDLEMEKRLWVHAFKVNLEHKEALVSEDGSQDKHSFSRMNDFLAKNS